MPADIYHALDKYVSEQNKEGVNQILLCALFMGGFDVDMLINSVEINKRLIFFGTLDNNEICARVLRSKNSEQSRGI